MVERKSNVPELPALGTVGVTPGQGLVRRPRGYVGRRHETLGSDILAVRDALVQLSGVDSPAAAAATCRQVLGPVGAEVLERVKPEAWYPIEQLLGLMDTIEVRIGPNGLRRLGRVLFQRSHSERAKAALKTAKDVIYGIDAMYRFANRGEQIGGWKVLSFTPNEAELEKTTPHHCVMEEGILAEACATLGAFVVVTQRECFRTGSEVCRYHLVPSKTGDPAWGAVLAGLA